MSDKELAQIIWDYMRYEQPVQKADIVIGLGCHDVGVARYAADLWLEGTAPIIMFCGATGRLTAGSIKNEADSFAEEAVSRGVPNSAILRENRSTNTGENIKFGHQLLKDSGLTPAKIIIVHKPYMLRRDYATIMKQWPQSAMIQFIFSAEQVSMEDYVSKLESFDQMVNIMVGDVQRIKEYPRLGFQIEQDIPERVWNAYNELVSRGYSEHLLHD